MKKKADYQNMLLKMLGFLWEQHLQDMETELQNWRVFPEFYGGLHLIGQEEERTGVCFLFIRRGLRREQIQSLRPIGGISIQRIREW